MSILGISNDFLSRHSMFGGLVDEELDVVRPYLHKVTFNEGFAVLTQGEPNSTVYFVVEGVVSIKKFTSDKKTKEREITRLKEGDSFGEMELIDIQNCAASVYCETEVVCITLSNYGLYLLSKSHLQIYTMIIMNLARDISRRLRSTDNLLAMVAPSEEL